MKISFVILVFVFLFRLAEKMVKVKDANMKKSTLPIKCYKDYDNLVCRAFKNLREFNLKWENCNEYKEPALN